jgi:hypothetical protein
MRVFNRTKALFFLLLIPSSICTQEKNRLYPLLEGKNLDLSFAYFVGRACDAEEKKLLSGGNVAYQALIDKNLDLAKACFLEPSSISPQILFNELKAHNYLPQTIDFLLAHGAPTNWCYESVLDTIQLPYYKGLPEDCIFTGAQRLFLAGASVNTQNPFVDYNTPLMTLYGKCSLQKFNRALLMTQYFLGPTIINDPNSYFAILSLDMRNYIKKKFNMVNCLMVNKHGLTLLDILIKAQKALPETVKPSSVFQNQKNKEKNVEINKLEIKRQPKNLEVALAIVSKATRNQRGQPI